MTSSLALASTSIVVLCVYSKRSSQAYMDTTELWIRGAHERQAFELDSMGGERIPADVFNTPVPQQTIQRYLAALRCQVALGDNHS